MRNNLTKRDYSYIELAIKHAISNEKVAGARASAILVLKNRVIAFGRNQYKTHPLQAVYGKNSDAIYLHAEIDVIRNALREINQDELKRASLYIARVKKSASGAEGMDIWGLAHPCRGCLRAIENFNIGKVCYTTNENGIIGLMVRKK